VVQRQVEQLGGSVSCEAAPGKGARFVLRVPISVALTHVLIVALGEELFALPVTAVTRIARQACSALEPTGAGTSVKLDEERFPVAPLATLLARPAPTPRAHCDLVVIENGGRQLALAVERIRGQRHSVVRALDPLLSGVGMVTGTVELEGGGRALVLNVPELFRLASCGEPAAGRKDEPVAARRRILIVDDSLFAREMLGGLLRRLDYSVVEARDGAEGFEKLLSESPDLLMTDVDMPVLDGIGLIEKIREIPAHRQLPVVVLSTRGSDADKRRAMLAGANAYLVKSNFDEAEVARAIRKLLR
jgi:CheY-like chemotaxis protein/chemotaxis signal transduction protein